MRKMDELGSRDIDHVTIILSFRTGGAISRLDSRSSFVIRIAECERRFTESETRKAILCEKDGQIWVT